MACKTFLPKYRCIKRAHRFQDKVKSPSVLLSELSFPAKVQLVIYNKIENSFSIIKGKRESDAL